MTLNKIKSSARKREDFEEVPHKYRIIVSVGPYQGEKESKQETSRIARVGEELNAVPVEWGADPDKLDRLRQKHGDVMSYVISAVDSANKVSEYYGACLGVAAVGETHDSSEQNIGLLAHTLPGWIGEKKFDRDLSSRLSELKAASKKGTVDVLIFGGDISRDRAHYRESAASLVMVVHRIFSIDPRVYDPTWYGASAVALDVARRRLHMARNDPEQEAFESLERPGSKML